MVKFTIADKDYDINEMREIYKTIKTRFDNVPNELDLIFEVALRHKDRFPVININDDKTAEEYIERWVKSYCNSMNHLPSTRTAERKSSCTDPAIKVIVKTTRGLSEAEAEAGDIIIFLCRPKIFRGIYWKNILRLKSGHMDFYGA